MRRSLSVRWRAVGAALIGLPLLYVLALAAAWPDVVSLRTGNPRGTAFMERYAERSGRAPAWTWVPSSRISGQLKEAVLVAEDLEFFSHDGFSRHEMEQALRKAIREREMPRGASTITQQLAKNLWLSPSRNPVRKLREAQLTRNLERHLTKARILEIYLNVVEFGPGIYGAEAAARSYFGKPAADLGPREAAMLAAALSRPSRWHPGVTTSGYTRRVELLLARMRQVTFLDRYLGLAADPISPDSSTGLPVPADPEEDAGGGEPADSLAHTPDTANVEQSVAAEEAEANTGDDSAEIPGP